MPEAVPRWPARKRPKETSTESPGQLAGTGFDFLASLNPNSLSVVQGFVEPALATSAAGTQFQFERHGYFVADRVDHQAGKPVFNRAVGLKDSWGK